MSVYKGDKLVAGRVHENTVSISIAPSSNFTGHIVLAKKGNNVTLTFANIKCVSATGSTVIATLPKGILPSINCFCALCGDNNVTRIVYIKDDGNIVAGTSLSNWFDNEAPIELWSSISFITK